jgi:hypothetical protein
VTTHFDRDAAEQWFRRRGLPTVVQGRPTGLLIRILPAEAAVLAWRGVGTALYQIDGDTDAEYERLMENDAFALFYLTLLAGLVVAPVLSAWLTARLTQRWRAVRGRGSRTAVVVAVLFVLAAPVVGLALPPHKVPYETTLEQVVLLAVFVAGAHFGASSILGWALRAAFRQISRLGDLTSRALPLLLLFTVFGFFTNEIWQVAAALSRGEMWLLVALFAGVAVLFLCARLSDEVRDLTDSHQVGRKDFQNTPFEACLGTAEPSRPTVPLRRLEQANMILVLVLTQMLQTFLLSALTFLFFNVLGVLSIRDSVLRAWTKHAFSGGSLLGFQVPFPDDLIQVCLFIAAVSALYFSAAAVTDVNHRRSFFDPLVRHLAVSMTARDVYLAELRSSDDSPQPAASSA